MDGQSRDVPGRTEARVVSIVSALRRAGFRGPARADRSAEGPPRVGAEEWLKRASIVLAFLFINGHRAYHAYLASLGISPTELGVDEKEYLIQGLLHCLLDKDSILHPSWELRWYYLCVLGTLVLFVSAIWIAFGGTERWKRFSGPGTQALLLAGVFVTLCVVATLHGDQRARFMRANFDRLPNVLVVYESPESPTGLLYFYSHLLARTEHVVCVAKLSSLSSGTNFLAAADNRVHVLRMEKVVRINIEPPWPLRPKPNQEKQ